MVPTLQRVVGADKVVEIKPRTPSEDFSFYAREIPALFYFVGITPAGVPGSQVAIDHSPRFQIDEAGLLPALRATVHIAFDYLSSAK